VTQATEQVGRPRARLADERRAGQAKHVGAPRFLGRHVHETEPGKHTGLQPPPVHQQRFPVQGAAAALAVQAASVADPHLSGRRNAQPGVGTEDLPWDRFDVVS
jgi:hypothetical protein